MQVAASSAGHFDFDLLDSQLKHLYIYRLRELVSFSFSKRTFDPL